MDMNKISLNALNLFFQNFFVIAGTLLAFCVMMVSLLRYVNTQYSPGSDFSILYQYNHTLQLLFQKILIAFN